MSIWSTYCSYQYPFASLSDFGFNSMPYGNLFSMPVFPKESVFDSNIFGITPSANFCNLFPNSSPQQYFSPINLTNPFMTYDFTPRNLTNIFTTQDFAPKTSFTDNIFGFLKNQTTTQLTSNSTTTSNNSFGFLTTNSSRTNKTSFNTSSNLPSLKSVGYNPVKAQKLANAINSTSPKRWGDKQCAAHVKDAISNAGLGARVSGDAYQMISQLQNNSNFKEISTEGLNLSELPAGCVLVYDKGVAQYSSQYGHTEITLGNGKALSSGYTNYIKDGARVFIPV